MKFTLIKIKTMNKDTFLNDNVIDDSNLAQCDYCGFVEDWDEIPNVSDPWSDGTVTCCPECNQGETFTSYKAEK
jgi:hypothetical protein